VRSERSPTAAFEVSAIVVAWVDLESVPGLARSLGRLGMTGIHGRDLARDAEQLRDRDRVNDLLLLVEDQELIADGMVDPADALASAGIAVHRHPIPDFGVPSDRDAFQSTLEAMRSLVTAGRSVVIACHGGLGRTGTFVACLLREGGLDADAAIALTRATRHGAIETGVQERFIGEWR
jgi:Cyclin-dependent kinase inhibitor 3 (CDKN3)